MLLEKVHIEDYGPHDLPSLEFGDRVNVVYGPNESGKTLLVDALLYLLTGQNEDDRIGQPPRGYLKIDEGTSTYRLDGGETILDRLSAATDLDLEAREFRNTFVVRSADSQLASDHEYYDRATDVVAESLVEDIKRVRRAVRNRGRITATGLLIDRQDSMETKTHHRRAKSLLEDIDAYVEEAHEEGVPVLEAEWLETKQQIDRKKNEVDRLEAAKKYQKLKEQRKQKKELRLALKTMGELPSEEDVEDLSTDVKETLAKAEQLDATSARREAAQTNVRRAVVATVVGAVGTLGLGNWALLSLGPSFVGWIAIAMAGAVVAAVPGALSVYFWQQRGDAQAELDTVQAGRSDVLQRARRLGIQANELSAVATRLAELKDQIGGLQRTVTKLHGELRGALDLESDTPSETLERATDELERRVSEIEDPPEIDFKKDNLRSTKAELDKLKTERDELAANLEAARSKIESYADDVANLPFVEYGLESPQTDVKSVAGLEGEVDRLSALIQTIEMDADNARAADDALDALKKDEQSRVGELFFGTESRVSETFAQITDGRYESVQYDEAHNELWVRTASGLDLSPEQLSQSTFDQLYFAVRTIFAQEIFVDQPGFLLLDDAFLAADASRLERQVEIIDELAMNGWQVLYFTANEAAKDQLLEGADAVVHILERFE
jgi:hypothetical protein